MFQGFTDQTVDFLWEIRFNNNREWFAEHKPVYLEHVQKPMKELTSAMYDWFSAAYPNLCMNTHISRIYRDARRLFGRGPYKDHLWCSFQTASNGTEVPCFFFELAPEGWSYGVGYFADRAGMSERFRRFVDANPKKLDKLVAAFEKQDEFKLYGQSYARSKGHQGERIEPWYNKKSIALIAEQPYNAVSNSQELLAHLQRAFTFLMPYFRYLDQVYKSVE